MKLEKAIEILSLTSELPELYRGDVEKEAQKLGIEALKTVLDTRRLPGMAGWRVLPGETEE